jgi:hypothetical protein
MNRDPYGQTYYNDVQTFAMTDVKLNNPDNLLDIYIKKRPLGKAAKEDPGPSSKQQAQQTMDGAGDCQAQGVEISPSEPFEGPAPEESSRAGSLVRERVKKLEECAALANKKAEETLPGKARAKSVQPRPKKPMHVQDESVVNASKAGGTMKSRKMAKSLSYTELPAKPKVNVFEITLFSFSFVEMFSSFLATETIKG